MPVHKALRRAKSVAIGKLKIGSASWEDFKQITEFFHKTSHPTVLALGWQRSFADLGMVVLGPVFDQVKARGGAYEKEIHLRISACRLLGDVVEIIRAHMANVRGE